MKPDRIPCCIPFCRRTDSLERFPWASEIICAPCGRLVPLERKLYKRARGAALQAERSVAFFASIGRIAEARRARSRQDRMWDIFKRKASAAKLRAMEAGL